MANLTEISNWEDGIYRIETSDPVLGGEEGIANKSIKQLANRTKYLKSQVDNINRERTGYASKTSPAFIGVPTAPTAAASTNNAQIATTAFVKTAIAALVGSAPAALDTLEELARALAGDANLKATLLAEIAKKANLSHTHTMAQITDFEMKNLNTEDLNSIKKAGFYAQPANANCTPARNYPEQQAGSLEVRPSTYGWQQEYTVFSSGNKYVRNNVSGGNFSPWFRVDALDLHDLFVGVPIPYPLSTVPTGCLAMNGQRFDTRRYPKLAQKYPSGQLPDLRGEFIRGWDNGRGVDAGRGLLSAQGDAIRNIIGEVNTDNGWFFNTLVGAFYDSKEAYTNQQKQRTRAQVMPANDVPGLKKGYFGFDASRVVPTANENRPRNIAFHYICLAA